MLKVGDKVKYIGPDIVAYDKDVIYTIASYDKDLNLYGVESELDEVYLLSETVLKKVN